MKPDWDKLISAYKDHASILVADVDCTGKGKTLCQEAGIRGYPTIKYGAPEDLKDYKGGRGFKALKDWADGLKPTCSPLNLDLCDDEKKALISKLQALSVEERAALLQEKEAEIERLEAEHKETVESLQKQYQEVSAEKEKKLKAVKDKGLSLLKSVHANEAKAKKRDDL